MADDTASIQDDTERNKRIARTNAYFTFLQWSLIPLMCLGIAGPIIFIICKGASLGLAAFSALIVTFSIGMIVFLLKGRAIYIAEDERIHEQKRAQRNR